MAVQGSLETPAQPQAHDPLGSVDLSVLSQFLQSLNVLISSQLLLFLELCSLYLDNNRKVKNGTKGN